MMTVIREAMGAAGIEPAHHSPRFGEELAA